MTSQKVAGSIVVFVGLAILAWIFLAPAEPKVDFEQSTDDRLKLALQHLKRIDAIQYFENGGRYIDSPGDPPFDLPQVVPLLKTLEKEFRFEWIVLVRPNQPADALELIAEIPPGVTRRMVHARLVELQKNFRGDILQEWGTDWFSLEFNNEEESAYFREE